MFCGKEEYDDHSPGSDQCATRAGQRDGAEPVRDRRRGGVYSVTGEYDLVALLRLSHYDDLADVVTARMMQLPTITKTHTLMAFQRYSRADLQQAWDIGIE